MRKVSEEIVIALYNAVHICFNYCICFSHINKTMVFKSLTILFNFMPFGRTSVRVCRI